MRIVAGLLVMSNDSDGLFALLQRRGEWEFDESRPESYPFGCQATAAGKLEPEDNGDPYAGMMREVRQELGRDFADYLAASNHPTHLSVWQSPERHATHFSVLVQHEALSLIRLHPSTAGLVKFRRGSRIVDLMQFGRDTGVNERSTIAAYQEVIEALEVAFIRYG